MTLEVIHSLVTGTAKEEFESGMLPLLNGELPQDLVDMYYDVMPADIIDEMLPMLREMMQPMLKQMFGSGRDCEQRACRR